MRTRLLLVLATFMLATPLHAQDRQSWIPTWYAPPAPVADTPVVIQDTTVRQVIHTSAGGRMVRIRLSNAFGISDLHIDKAAIADRAGGSAIVAGSGVAVTFAGKPDVTVAPGAYVLSDPIPFNVAPQSDLSVSLFVSSPATASTIHLQQRNATYFAAGDATLSASLTPAAPPATGADVLWLSEVEVAQSPAKATVVAFGDSITDGMGPKPDLNATWPDGLTERFRKAGLKLSVIDAGISGNRLLHNGTWAPFGTAGLARFDTDVLAQPNVRAVIVLIGINDIGQVGQGASDYVAPEAIEAGLAQLAARAHAHGLKIYVGTLTPFKVTTIKAYYSDAKEAQRQAVNAWIRGNTVFDGVADFDKALDDPANPGHMLPADDSGDHLHPSAGGDAAIAAAVPLNWFK